MTNRYIFKYILVIILFVFANLIVLAQQKITFHTDRDYYFPGDTIWYKTYIHLNGKLDTSIHNLLVAFGKENTEILEQQLRQVNWGLCYGQYVLPIDYESSDVYINIFSKRNISDAEIVTPESFKLAVIQKKNVPTSDEANLIIQVEGNGWLPNALNKMVFHWNSKDVVEAKLVDQEGNELEMLNIDRYAKAFTEIKSSSNQVYVHWKSKDKSYLDTVPSLKSNIRMRVSEESDTTFVYIENQSDLSSVNFQYEQGNYILLDTLLTLEKNQIIKLSMQDLLIGRFMGNFLLKNKNQLLSKISFHPKVKDSLKIEPEHLLFRPYAPQRLALEMPGNEEWNLSVSIVDGLIPNSMLKNQKANYQFETSRHVFHYESQDKLMNYSGELYDPIANLTGKIIMEDQQWKKFMELRKEREERMKKRKKEFRAVSFGIKKVAHINYVYRVVDFDSLGNLILPNMTFQDTFQTRIVQIDDRLKTINYELEWKFSPLPSLKQLTIPDYLKNLDLSTQYLGRYDPNTYNDEFGETIIKSIGINRKIKESIHKDLINKNSEGWFRLNNSELDIDIETEDLPAYVFEFDDLMRYLRKKYPILGPDGNTNLQPMMLFNNSNFFADVIQIPKDITEVKFIRYYKDYSADRNGRGLIMVYTTGINGRNKDIGVAKIKKSLISGYHVVKDFHQVKYEGEVQVDYDDRQTLYWNPDLDLKAGEEKTISFFNSGINTSFTVRVKGVSRSGKTIDIVKHFQEAHENLE